MQKTIEEPILIQYCLNYHHFTLGESKMVLLFVPLGEYFKLLF